MTAAEIAEGFRKLADAIDRNPDAVEGNTFLPKLNVYCLRETEFVRMLGLLEGEGTLVDDTDYFKVARSFGAVTLTLRTHHSEVCDRSVRVAPVEISEWTPHAEIAAQIREPEPSPVQA